MSIKKSDLAQGAFELRENKLLSVAVLANV